MDNKPKFIYSNNPNSRQQYYITNHMNESDQAKSSERNNINSNYMTPVNQPNKSINNSPSFNPLNSDKKKFGN